MTVPIRRNTAGQSVNVSLFDAAGALLANPTIAAGDFQVSVDDGAFGNPATLPVVDPVNSGQVVVALSQPETNGDKIGVRWVDQAGAQWMSGYLFVMTSTSTLADLASTLATIIADIAAVAADVWSYVIRTLTG